MRDPGWTGRMPGPRKPVRPSGLVHGGHAEPGQLRYHLAGSARGQPVTTTVLIDSVLVDLRV